MPEGVGEAGSPADAVTVLLVRHCSAGAREAWRGDDRMRPLDGVGLRQAMGLVRALADCGGAVARVLSSPFLRCEQSVLPLAQSLGVPVEIDGRLAEGSGDGALLLLRGLGAAGAVLCTHGDVVPRVLERLAEEDGVDLGPAPRWEKGSMWVLTGPSPARFSTARYLRPPAVG